MRFQRVLCIVRGDDTDDDAVNTAVDILDRSRPRLFIAYVIVVDYRLPIDAALPEQMARAEEALARAEETSGLGRNEVHGQILQGRSFGPTIVHETVERDIGAVVTAAKLIPYFGSQILHEDIHYLLTHVPTNLILVRKSQLEFEEEHEQRVAIVN